MTPLRAVPKPRRKKKAARRWGSSLPVSSAPKVRPPKRKVAKRKIQKSSTRKAKNWKRKPSETLRIYGSKPFRDHVHASACLWCGARGNIQQAHIGKHPMGKKLGWEKSGPLCFSLPFRVLAGCHDRYDRRREPFFSGWARESIAARQRDFYNAWQAYSAGRKSA
jgi:hypothetical protein